MSTLLVVVAALAFTLIVHVVLTHGTARFLRAENATWRRAAVVVSVISSVPLVLVVALYATGVLNGSAILVAAGAVSMIFPFVVYRYAYRAGWGQMVGFFGLQVALSGAAYGIALPMKWYLVEAFSIPTNGMAPSVCGERLEGPCPACGKTVVMTVDERTRIRNDLLHGLGTCIACGKDSPLTGRVEEKLPGDRICAAKFTTPQRWDVVVFQNPEDPQVNYLKRIVGLPGEEVVIKDDGYAWIDGKKLEPPEHLRNLRYTLFSGDAAMQATDGKPLWGDPRRPVQLGHDEYYLLGDNSYRSLDGRFWGPVKRDAILGTATLIYWPPDRWRILK